MLSGITISVVQQIKDASACEFKESKSDDENKDANEKESKTEKDVFAYKIPHCINDESWTANNATSKIHAGDEAFISSLYTFLPYNPPEL